MQLDDKILREHSAWMLALSLRVLGERALAEDAVQEAWLSAYLSGDQFEARADVRTWLYRITLNAALDVRRRQDRDARLVDHLQPVFDDANCRIEPEWTSLTDHEQLVADAEFSLLVQRFVDELPEDYASVLVLREFEDLSVRETAELLNVTEANVKVRSHRARAALKKRLEPVLRGQSVSDLLAHGGSAMNPDSSPEPNRLKGWMLRNLPMMITCEAFESFIQRYLDDELSGVQRRLFEFHIRTCSECREYLAAFESARSASREAVVRVTSMDSVPDDLLLAMLRALGM